MAIGSNPLSSTTKSARARVGSVFQGSLEVLMGWRGLWWSAAIIFLLYSLSATYRAGDYPGAARAGAGALTADREPLVHRLAAVIGARGARLLAVG
jgi:hypothetical protein